MPLTGFPGARLMRVMGRILLAVIMLAVPLHVIPEKRFQVPGLRAPAEIIVDRWGVPHIYAENDQDLFLAQGFNAARDRLFQLDLWRRRGLGLLSEVFGPEHAERDRAARLFLYRGDMDREWAAYGPGARQAATAFTAGINAYVAHLEEHPEAMPPEFTRLGYRPSRWRPEDVVRVRSHGLAMNLSTEVLRAAVVCKAGIEADRKLWRLQPAHETRVPRGLDPCAIPADVLRVYQLGTQGVRVTGNTLVTEPRAVSEGSNAWAVSPGRTATGRPVLASDPHRSLTAPALRYLTHLSAPGLDVIGAGEPALPGVSIGHNGTIAFGLTVFAMDQEDLYVYRTKGDSYAYKGGWEPFREVTEQIAGRPAKLTFTRHGPVIATDPERGLAYALRTTWLEPGTAPYFGSMRYLRARDFGGFTEAMRTWGGPPENQIYADSRGHVGWVPGGLAPKRTGYDGLLPVPGDGRYEWAGFRDGRELPRLLDPPAGFVASANEYNLPPGAPVVGYEWDQPFRRQRIDEVLSADQRADVRSSARLQNDVVSLPARSLVPLLRDLTTQDPSAVRALAVLKGFDGVCAVDSGPAALFETWLTRHLGPGFVAESGLPPEVPFFDLRTILEELARGGHEALIVRTLAAAYDDVAARLGPDPAAWRWGDLQRTTFTSAAGDDVGPFPRGGSAYTVNASTYLPTDFRHVSGASFRMVLDVGAWDNSLAINAPGQSGDPRDPHYRDLAASWQRGEYFPLVYGRAAVESAAAGRITLTPVSG
ncbi:penicillin acylase family protein [Nonomuraea maheshkhaliensis]|uniref:Penicillin acylase family protein n=2 Tax=Nonomuraea maheshkhaliensis TaxID=419590 RepID=A0ABN2GDM4_9ACTN